MTSEADEVLSEPDDKLREMAKNRAALQKTLDMEV